MEAQPRPIPVPQPPTLEFAPLPVRARGVLDILDLALRLYKRYFWVLVGWSALAAVLNVFGRSLLYVFVWPLLSGAAVCCVAAAIRGQRVRFGHCWQFTQPRYWPLVGVVFSSFLICLGIFLLLGLACAALFIGGALLLDNAPAGLKLTITIIGGILLLIIGGIVTTALMIWQGMVPIVACMEEDKRDRTALARAYHLLSGHWVRMIVMLTIIGLIGLVLYAILLAVVGSLTGLFTGFSRMGDLFSGRESPEKIMDSLMSFYVGLLFFQVLLSTLWSPLHHLILTLFYLDIRVRKEALDLEWTAYASAATPAATNAAAPTSTAIGGAAPVYAAEVDVASFTPRPPASAPTETPVEVPTDATGTVSPERTNGFN